jgi:Rrf2 family iron-sulfur cluster assembly transcriptional regulator
MEIEGSWQPRKTMKISSQEEYGLRCLLCLAAEEGKSLTIPEIAAAEGLSAPYVAKLLSVLRQAGLIDSVRGRAGGYSLARPATEITLGSVMGVLGEPLYDDPGYCQKHAGTESDGHCVHYGGCTLRALWLTLEEWMRHTLNQITLADLLQSEHRITDLLRVRLADAVLEPATTLITLNPMKATSGA